jgi:hypothetical protein
MDRVFRSAIRAMSPFFDSLLGISLFQRRSGSCRFADMQISQPGAAPLRL